MAVSEVDKTVFVWFRGAENMVNFAVGGSYTMLSNVGIFRFLFVVLVGEIDPIFRSGIEARDL